MADNSATPDQKKVPLDDPEAGFAENELDDSKAKFINGGNSLEETKVVIPTSPSKDSFTGLGKEELKKYAEDPFWIRLRWILFILFWVGWLAMLVAAIVIIVLAPRCPARPDLKWYDKDVAYNVYSKSFFDGEKDQDGYGDLAGVRAKKDYISDLNANVVWLSSIFKTDPDSNDRGIIDHKALDEKFGTLEDFKSFCKKLMKEGKRVIVDLIPNQTSKSHEWFQKSRKGEDKYASYYVWADSPNNWVREDGKQMWVADTERKQSYLSQFDGLPDLNLTNPDVIQEFKEIMAAWKNLGVSGFHINDLEYLAENSTMADDPNPNDRKYTFNNEENVHVVDSFREIVNGLDNKPGKEKMLTGTVTSSDPNVLKLYFGGEGKRGLNLVSVVLSQLTNVTDAMELQNTLEPVLNVSSKYRVGWRLTTSLPNTDRVFNRVGNKRVTIAHALQALLPGTSMPFYGDEIAMANGAKPDFQTLSPMQWSKKAHAGFTTGNSPWLPVNPDYVKKNEESLTAQLGDDKTVGSFIAMNELRTNESFQFGKTMFCSDHDLFIFSRNAPGFPAYLVVANLGSSETDHKFAGSECVGEHKNAKLVFHSQDDETKDMLNLEEAIAVGAKEVVVLKLPA